MSNTKELIESNSSAQDIVANLSEAFPTFRARDWSWEMKSYSGNPNDKMIYGTSPTEPSWVGFGWNSYDSELIAMYGDGHPKEFDIRDTERFGSWNELTKFLKKKNINPDRSLLSKLEREVKSKMENVNEGIFNDRGVNRKELIKVLNKHGVSEDQIDDYSTDLFRLPDEVVTPELIDDLNSIRAFRK